MNSKTTLDFGMGADPEFLILSGGYGSSPLYAEDYVSNSHDDFSIENFGSDGNGVLFEVRPEPSLEPLELVNNIRQIFLSNVIKFSEIRKKSWIAGSCYIFKEGEEEEEKYSLGGHIHFQIKRGIIKSSEATRILSQYLGVCTALIENTKEGYSRRNDKENCNYGLMNDYRPTSFGFEYRTPSSWLVSPYIAAAVLCLGKVVMFEILNNPKFYPREFVAAKEFKKMDVLKMKKQFPSIWKEIQKMVLYPFYKPYIDIIYFLIDNNCCWYPTCSMKEAWAVEQSLFIPRSSVSLNSIWSQYKNHPFS